LLRLLRRHLRELIHLYKYGRIQTLSRPLGGFAGGGLPLDERFDAVTPVPLHWRKQWQRGFNQSELLARAIARRRGFRWCGRCGARGPRKRRPG
jgi:predicted amidophosphoribosyltransferase